MKNNKNVCSTHYDVIILFLLPIDSRWFTRLLYCLNWCHSVLSLPWNPWYGQIIWFFQWLLVRRLRVKNLANNSLKISLLLPLVIILLTIIMKDTDSSTQLDISKILPEYWILLFRVPSLYKVTGIVQPIPLHIFRYPRNNWYVE